MNVFNRRPTTMTEMETLLDAARRFEDECKKQLGKLQTMASHCQQMSQPSSAREEIDAFHARWNGVNDAVTQQLQRLEDLHRTWTDVVNKVSFHCCRCSSFSTYSYSNLMLLYRS